MISSTHGPRAVCDLLDGLCANVYAKDVILAFNARAEIERAPVFDPSESAWDQIEVFRC